jgi:hypothetical protein
MFELIMLTSSLRLHKFIYKHNSFCLINFFTEKNFAILRGSPQCC